MSIEHQDALLKDIQSDLLTANSNLKYSTTEVVRQGDQLVNINTHLGSAETNIKQTDRTMNVIERRQKCYRLSLYILILVEFVVIVVILLVKILKHF